MNSILKRHWGFFYFILTGVLSIASVMKKGHSGHYDFFSASAQLIWHSQNPYGIAYPSGLFNYSPSCALFFYSLFAFFPYALGLFLYVASSFAMLCWALKKLTSLWTLKNWQLNIFYFFAASEVIGNILNTRIENFFMAVLCLSAAQLIQRKNIFWAYFFLAMITNFKLLSLPTVGLFLLIDLVTYRYWKSVVYFTLSLLGWYALPYAVKPVVFVNDCYRVWQVHLADLVKVEWTDFQHIYRFFSLNFGLSVSWTAAQAVSLAVGIFFALYVFWCARKKVDDRQDLYLLALSLGGLYACVFSPASQSAAYVLATPAILLGLILKSPQGAALVTLSWIFSSVVYSDLVPQTFRHYCFDHAWKPASLAVLTLGLLWLYGKTKLRTGDLGDKHLARLRKL